MKATEPNKKIIMKPKNIYAIKIDDINSDWVNYRLWKNEQEIDPDDLTIEELGFFQKELYVFSVIFKDRIIEMLKNQIKYLEEL